MCACAYLRHPAFAESTAAINRELGQVANPTLQTQLRVPLALAHLLPVGVKGMLCAIVFFALLACDSSYLHSWGAIIVQDVVLPLRRRGASRGRASPFWFWPVSIR